MVCCIFCRFFCNTGIAVPELLVAEELDACWMPVAARGLGTRASGPSSLGFLLRGPPNGVSRQDCTTQKTELGMHPNHNFH